MLLPSLLLLLLPLLLRTAEILI